MQALAWLTRINRPLTRRNRAGAIVAMLTCPCHVGVATILLSGTAIGGWLAAERAWMYALFTALFAAGLAILFRRDREACPLPKSTRS
jgi:MFS family permease